MSRSATRVDLYVALTEALVPFEDGQLSPEQRSVVIRDSAEFVRGQIYALPPRLLTLMTIALTGFRVLVRLRHLRSYCDLPLASRRQVAEWWAYGPVPLTRQMFRAIRATALLAYYEHRLMAPADTTGDRP
jgi:hypothetical protein